MCALVAADEPNPNRPTVVKANATVQRRGPANPGHQGTSPGKRETEIALALNPNYALAGNTRGNAEAYSGHPLAAIPYFERAMRLDPAFTQQYIHFLASAYLVAGQYKA
ncbi:MAG: hypothetical protein WBZ28_00825, partial [Pseudolabrys sp.]